MVKERAGSGSQGAREVEIVEESRDEKVEAWFDRFGVALSVGASKTIATMWETPAFVMADRMARVVGSSSEVEDFFAGVKEQYNARGIAEAKPDIQDIYWLTENVVLVDVRWPYRDGKGKEIGEESSTYTLQKNDFGELKLRTVVMRGEKKPAGAK